MADAGAMRTKDWLLTPRRDGAAAASLIVLPYAGVGASLAATLSRHIRAPVAIHGVQLPGRENRISEPPMMSMDAIIEALLPVLMPLARQPYVLMGCSFGALLGWELAQRLQAAGLPPRQMVILACASPTLRRFRTRLSELNDEDLLDALDRRFGGVPEVVREHEELRRLFMPGVRADVTVLDRYDWRPGAVLETGLLTIGGTGDREVSGEDLEAWAPLVRGPTEHVRIDGGHFVLREDPAAVAAELDARLTRWL
jgi:surfactin synthase thioesterase subunit